MNRFKKGLGATHWETCGYIVPDDATRYEDWSKDESATEIFKRWFQMMKDGAGYREVARWLNLRGPVKLYPVVGFDT